MFGRRFSSNAAVSAVIVAILALALLASDTQAQMPKPRRIQKTYPNIAAAAEAYNLTTLVQVSSVTPVQSLCSLYSLWPRILMGKCRQLAGTHLKVALFALIAQVVSFTPLFSAAKSNTTAVTVFAPTNAAFATAVKALREAYPERLDILSDIPLLTKVRAQLRHNCMCLYVG